MVDDKAPAAARVRASEAVLDRAWGKPETTANIGGSDGGPLVIATGVTRYRDLSDDQLRAIIAQGAGKATGAEEHEPDDWLMR